MKPEQPRARAGLIGLGQMGKNHARVFSESSGVDFVGICDPNPELGTSYRGVPIYPDLDALISAGLDLAVVSVPTGLHEEVAAVLAGAGVPTLIEKPIAPEVESARRIASLFQQSGVYAAIGHIERLNPAIRAMKSRIEQGVLGDIFQISTVRNSSYPMRISDVGCIMDLGTHDIDTVHYLTGSSYRSLAAFAQSAVGTHEDLAVISARLDSGVIVNHSINWLSPAKERRTVVYGEQGMLVADTLSSDLTLFKNAGAQTDWPALSQLRGVGEGMIIRYEIEKVEPLVVEHQSFLREAELGLNESLASPSDGVLNVRVAEAALAASRTKEVVGVDL